MAQTITEIDRTIWGNMRVVLLAFDANGTASGAYATGLDHVHVVLSQNSENHSEAMKIVKNSNDGTEGSVEGSIYITAADGTNNTGYIVVIGI